MAYDRYPSVFINISVASFKRIGWEGVTARISLGKHRFAGNQLSKSPNVDVKNGILEIIVVL